MYSGTAFAGRPESDSPGDPGWTILKFKLPIFGRKTYEGGPWKSLTLLTNIGDWDGFSPPNYSNQRSDFVIRLDDGAELWLFPNVSYSGLGSFRKIEMIDKRTSFFIPFDVQLFLTNDDSHFLFQGKTT